MILGRKVHVVIGERFPARRCGEPRVLCSAKQRQRITPNLALCERIIANYTLCGMGRWRGNWRAHRVHWGRGKLMGARVPGIEGEGRDVGGQYKLCLNISNTFNIHI